MTSEPLVQGPLSGPPSCGGNKAKHAAVTSCSGIESPAGARDKEEATRREYDLLDCFNVLDMLAEEGIGGLGELIGAEPKAKAAPAVVKKHPVGCRQRNVVRRRVCPSIDRDLSEVKDPRIRASKSWFKEYLDKTRDEAERNRLEYLKNAV